jgi:hypothetical protein
MIWPSVNFDFLAVNLFHWKKFHVNSLCLQGTITVTLIYTFGNYFVNSYESENGVNCVPLCLSHFNQPWVGNDQESSFSSIPGTAEHNAGTCGQSPGRRRHWPVQSAV